jgi:hypothetical protein
MCQKNMSNSLLPRAIEMRKEQLLRENNPQVQALYEQYRRAINLVHNNG